VGKRAVYPGMFDPMHNGHLDLIERSLRIFDELIVAVVANPSKQPLFEVKERLEMIDEATAGMGRMRITSFDGLLIDLAHREQADCIVRGIRAVSDFEYEFQMAGMNRYLLPEVETMFLTPSDQYQFISGTIVREIALLGGDVSKFVFPSVERWLKTKVAQLGGRPEID
jgi:pantetheine-phosphate adenylyltransferase